MLTLAPVVLHDMLGLFATITLSASYSRTTVTLAREMITLIGHTALPITFTRLAVSIVQMGMAKVSPHATITQCAGIARFADAMHIATSHRTTTGKVFPRLGTRTGRTLTKVRITVESFRASFTVLTSCVVATVLEEIRMFNKLL